MRVERRPMPWAFLGLRFGIGRNIPASHASQARGRDADSIKVLRHAGHQMVRSALPEPVGTGFGIIAKALLAFAKGDLGPVAVLDVGRRTIPFDNVACLVAQRLGAKQEPAIFTIVAPEPSFKLAWPAGLPYRAPLLQHVLLVVRMKGARPSRFGLVQSDAGIVEGWLIEEVGHPVRPGAPDQGRDRVDDQSQAILGLFDFVKSVL